jgi:lipopolysaccharide/colanic/teichoic acid biosynthesis glycosyltransferase
MNRAFDLPVALLGLVVTAPVVLAAAVAVKLDSPGSAFYAGPRVGRAGRPFRIHKLRTMRAGEGPAITAGDDPRITRVGRFLRRTKIDELPQLFNVVKGEMSLVGPRPEDPDYVALYTPEQRRLLSVRPGITGPAALAFADEETILRGGDGEKRYLEQVMPRKLALELSYLEGASFASDVGILVRTAMLIGRGRAAST